MQTKLGWGTVSNVSELPDDLPASSESDSARSRGSLILGAVEIVIGSGLVALGCYGWAVGDSAQNVGGTLAIAFGLVGLLLPGALLCTDRRGRWLGQLVPALVVTAYLVGLVLGRTPH